MPPQPDRALVASISAIASGLYKDSRAPWPFQTRRICVRMTDAHSGHGITGTSRGTRAALIAASDAESMRTIGRKQRPNVLRSKVNRRLHLGAPV